MDGIVIIGAGECGTRAAFTLREAGYSGSVTLVGSEPHLPYERPPLSKPMNGAVQMKLICAAEALEAAGIDYLAGLSASKLNADAGTVTLSDGRVLRFEKLLLATGARPRRLTCAGAELALDLRTHADAEAIFSSVAAGLRVAVIGGGLIGMELASVLRGKDAAVNVIEAAPKPLGRAVPQRFAEKLHARHVAEGVRFHLDRGVVAIGDEGVTLTDGSMVPADLVVSAIGVLPETTLAEAAGLATGNGIQTDACLRTSAPNVFAAGDCAAVAQPGGGLIRYESWRNARTQAETAARNMAGAAETFTAIPWFWSDQYDLGLQVAGLPKPAHQRVLRSAAGANSNSIWTMDASWLRRVSASAIAWRRRSNWLRC